MPEKNVTAESKISKKCTCCPYGFHIDRDFVRFCNSLYNNAQLDKLRQHKRERRKEKKSVESYLGLGNFTLERNNHTSGTHQNQIEVPKDHTRKICTSSERFSEEFYLQNDDLKNAVNDFEDTWKNSLTRSVSSHSIPNANGKKCIDCLVSPCVPQSGSLPSVNSEESKENRLSSSYISSSSSDFCDSVMSDSKILLSPVSKPFNSIHQTVGINKSVLTNIREQMASSLHHMKELEEQVKSIPLLKVKISNLFEEKQSLLNELKLKENMISVVNDSCAENDLQKHLTKLENEGVMSPTLSKRCLYQKYTQSHNFSPKIDSPSKININIKNKFKSEMSYLTMNDGNDPDKQKYKKSVGTSCNVLTRDIGTGYIPNKYKSVAVGSDFYSSDCVFKSGSFEKQNSTSSGSLESDLDSLSGKSDVLVFCPKTAVDQLAVSGTLGNKASLHIMSVDSSTNTDLQYVDKCLNTENVSSYDSNKHFASKKYVKHKSISALPSMINKYIQVSNKVILKHTGVQTSESKVAGTTLHLFKYHDFGVGDFDITHVVCDRCNKNRNSVAIGDCDINTVMCTVCDKNKTPTFSKTIGVGEFDINALDCKNCSRNIESDNKIKVTSTGTNTNSNDNFARKNIYICDKCGEAIHSVAQGLAADHKDSASNSNITKIQASVKRFPVLKPLDIDSAQSVAKDAAIFQETKLEKETSINVRHKSEAVGFQDGKNLSVNTDSNLNTPFSSEVLPEFTNLPHIPREKYELPKEVRAACKVLNDHLQKVGASDKKMLSSLKVIQVEWFQAANQKKADPHLIEDYIDAFEGFSKLLLHKIVNLSDNNGNTALHYAVSYGNFDVVSILIDSKVCDVNMKNKAGYTSIMLVALAEMRNDAHHYVVQRLFSIGDINMKATQNGQTALMLAVSHGKADIVKILLDVGADINLQDKDGSTALMCAAEHGHLEIAKILLSHSECDPTVLDNDGCTALTIAMEAGHKNIGLLIYTDMNFSHGSSPYSTLKARKRSTPRSTPPPHTPTLRTPPIPSPATKSMNSLTTFHFS